MSKDTKLTPLPTEKRKKYAPTKWEVTKTVIIAVLITGIIAFVAGIRYANSQQAAIDSAVTKAVTAKK